MYDKNQILVSCAIIFKELKNKKKHWFVIQNEDGNWEFPRTTVRKVESSVRAIFRMIGEQAGMTIKVLEEVGRAGGSATVANKTVPVRNIYYLTMRTNDSGESVGFKNSAWIETSKAPKSLTAKRDLQMFNQAKKVLSIWEKEKKHLQPPEEEIQL